MIRAHTGGDGGSVAAEFAVAIPAIMLTLLLGIGALGAAAAQVSLQDAVADAARLLGRGESDARVHAAVAASLPGVSVSAQRRGEIVCASGRVSYRVAPFIEVPLSATGCALDGGW